MIMDKFLWIVMFKTYFERQYGKDTMSVQFSEILSDKLLIAIEQTMGYNPLDQKKSINVGSVIRNIYYPDLQQIETELELIYTVGVNVTVHWKSNKGLIIQASDTQIDVNDMEVWIENIDLPFSKLMLSNEYQWITFLLRTFYHKYGKGAISPAFYAMLIHLFPKAFFEKTGIELTKKSTKIGMTHETVHLEYSIGKIKTSLFVLDSQTPITFCWQSKSEKIVTPSDEVIDINDVELWIEELNVPLIHDTLKTKRKLPFRIKKTKYTLEVEELQVEGMYLLITLNEKNIDKATQIVDFIDNLITAWNEKSETQNRRYGVIHDYNANEIQENYIEFYIDYGSAALTPLKNILEGLNAYPIIDTLKLTSFP